MRMMGITSQDRPQSDRPSSLSLDRLETQKALSLLRVLVMKLISGVKYTSRLDSESGFQEYGYWSKGGDISTSMLSSFAMDKFASEFMNKLNEHSNVTHEHTSSITSRSPVSTRTICFPVAFSICSICCHVRLSWTKLIEIPLRPKRPVRPDHAGSGM